MEVDSMSELKTVHNGCGCIVFTNANSIQISILGSLGILKTHAVTNTRT